jgi:hypothetical protein
MGDRYEGNATSGRSLALTESAKTGQSYRVGSDSLCPAALYLYFEA